MDEKMQAALLAKVERLREAAIPHADIEKAKLINCPASTSSSGVSTDTLVAIVVPFSVLLALSVSFVLYMRSKEMEGKPIYSPLVPSEEKSSSVTCEVPEQRVSIL